MTLGYSFIDEDVPKKKKSAKAPVENFTSPAVPAKGSTTPAIAQIPQNAAAPYINLELRPTGFGQSPNYSSQQSDQNYACRNYGICPPGYTPPPPPPPKIEGFDGSYQSTCESVELPRYGQEAGPEILAKMQEMNGLMEMTQADFQRFSLPQPKQPLGALSGDMIDEELSSYLQETGGSSVRSQSANPPYLSQSTSSFPGAAAITTKPPMYESKPVEAKDKDEPVAQSQTGDKCPDPCSPCPSPCPACPPRLDRMGMLMEVGMFVLAGILVIFLLEQIFRMGIMMGMKQTTQFLTPFMDYANSVSDGKLSVTM